MEACYAERSKGCRDALPQLPIRKLPDQIHTRAFCVVTCARSGTDDGKEKYDRRRATSAEWGCAQHTSGLGAGRRPHAQRENPTEPRTRHRPEVHLEWLAVVAYRIRAVLRLSCLHRPARCSQETSLLRKGRAKLRRPGREVWQCSRRLDRYDRESPCGDGETQLVERKGERHPHRLVEFLSFALMHDRDHEIIRFDLELFERLEVVRRVRLAHEIQNALEEPQAPRARVPAQIAR